MMDKAERDRRGAALLGVTVGELHRQVAECAAAPEGEPYTLSYSPGWHWRIGRTSGGSDTEAKCRDQMERFKADPQSFFGGAR